jgi:hypothetical protein
MSWDNHTNNIQEAIFGDKIYVPDSPHIEAGKTPPGFGEGIGNAQGWIAFAALLGALVGAIVGRGVIGGVVGALVLGGGLFAVIRLVTGNISRPRSIGPWPLWAAIGALVGALIPVGLAAAAGDFDDLLTVLVLGGILAVPGAAFFAIIRLVLRRVRGS